MDHLALSSTRFITAPFSLTNIRMSQQKIRIPAHIITCQGATGLGNTRGKVRKDFYRLLSITSPKSVGCEEIKRAYRSMALRYHPDVCRDESMKEELTKMFVQLNEAYRTLSDPVLRNEYDFELGLSGLGCDDFHTSCTENDRSDLERQFEQVVWQDHQGSETRNVQEDASELRRRNTCRTMKKGHNRMRK